jgi:hypothetical protein
MCMEIDTHAALHGLVMINQWMIFPESSRLGRWLRQHHMMGCCGRTFTLDHIKVYTFADSPEVLDASKAIFAPETEKQKKKVS